MNAMTLRKRKRHTSGFTLVELLVVIAIIGILAGIVVPNVAKFLGKGQMTRAVAEIKNAETSLIAVLADTGRANFKDFFTDEFLANIHDRLHDNNGAFDPNSALANIEAIQDIYDQFFYELLRLGRDSDFVKNSVKPEIFQKLGTGYMTDISEDPWGTGYHFAPGPQRRGLMIYRSYHILDEANPDDLDVTFQPFYWIDADITYNDGDNTQNPYQSFSANLPGQPRADDDFFNNAFGAVSIGIDVHAYGYPATKDKPVYIWSEGPNLENDANLLAQFRGFQNGRNDEEFLGGGDDPNNWDSTAGWDKAPQ